MSIVATLESSLTFEQLDALADEIATFATRIDVAEHALLTRLRVFDAHEAWGNQGARSCAEWLSWRTNLSIKAAREKVRVARALGFLPKIDGLFGRGELSYSKIRAITRVATAESEQHWIDVALHASASKATGDDLEELERFSRDADLYIDGSTAPTWDGTRVGVAEALDWMLLAERGLRAAA